MRQSLEPLARRGNVEAIATLAGPDFPDALTYFWHWFLELDATRPPAFAGLAPITHESIRAWRENLDRHLKPHEVLALVRLDHAYRKALSENS